MSDAKYTPGPYRISRGAQGDAFAIEAATRTVAHVKHARHLTETDANARLFAAAPDLKTLLFEHELLYADMKDINDGGPAFPLYHPSDGLHAPFAVDGMSLRAYIATEVFAQHEAVEYVTSCSGEDLQRRACNAVAAADALIAALNEQEARTDVA